MPMKAWFALAVALVLCCIRPAEAASPSASAQFKMVTASARGTYIRIGRDIAAYVAPPAGIALEVLPSAGSAENVRRLRHEPGVKLAIIQSDVYQAFLDAAAAGDGEAGTLIKPLRVIMPLYNEEIYFVARADSPLEYVHDIRGARINAGELGSGTALTTVTLYRLMFGEGLPERRASYLTNEDALVKLIDDRSVDVVVIVAGQPAKLLADMKPEARQLIKLLKFDPGHSTSEAALKTYFPATILSASYPNLLQQDLPGLAVKAFLVTYDYRLEQTRNDLTRFAWSLCQNLPILQEKGHAKWQEVTLSLPDLGRGWLYYPPATRALRECIAGNVARATPTGGACTQQKRVLGLC